jgi:DNA mismatch repair protein MutS2
LNTSKKSSTKQSGSTHKNGNVTFSNNKAQNVASEINVIGLTVDQALPIVDKYLDDCYMANLENARIVHGKGTGRLRDGIHSFLKKNPHVKGYRMGTYGEGEMGVTVVSFK